MVVMGGRRDEIREVRKVGGERGGMWARGEQVKGIRVWGER